MDDSEYPDWQHAVAAIHRKKLRKFFLTQLAKVLIAVAIIGVLICLT